MNSIIKKYKAVAQSCRLRIIHLLINSSEPLCICEMMDILKKEQYQISRCLSILKDADLIEENRDGRLLLFNLKIDDPFNKNIFNNLKIIDKDNEGVLKNDLEKLKKRLSLRENGKIVITYSG